MKHYSKEFRLQAARLVVEQGYSYVEVAQRLGPSAWSVCEWVAKYRKTGELAAAGSTPSRTSKRRWRRW